MENKFLKLKLRALLFFLSFLKKAKKAIFSFLEKINNFSESFLFSLLKFFILPIFPFYLKIRNLIKKNLHYQSLPLFIFDQKRLLIFFLIFALIFIFFEEKIPFPEKFFAQAVVLKENSDFKIASNEPEEIILKQNVPFEEDFIPTRTEIEKYIVQPGDTIYSIAQDFNVSVNTILWENKLTLNSIIKPGQVLRILPVSGVSHKVKPGDTVKKIAQLYRADEEEIIKFNNLEEEPLKVGDIIIIPEGKIPPPPPAPRIARKSEKIWPADLGEKTRRGRNCRDFYPGQCTWYVAQKICITFSGHAKDWLKNAVRAGYQIGKIPKVGAIVSLRETWYGHVAIVEEVKENSIVISEMNHLGPWRVNKREININDWRINGYIYPRADLE